MILSFILIFVFSAITSWLFVAAIIPLLNNGLLDCPNNRSSHVKPTPRGGGISFVLVSSLASVFALCLSLNSNHSLSPLILSPLLSFPLSVVGFIDDRFNLPSTWRFVVQLATAFAIVLISPLVVPSYYFLILFPLMLIAVTAVINFTNFMDGLDGLVAGSVSVSIATAAIIVRAPWPIWVLVASLLGFLCWNWSPAKVFMGDVGSTFLGSVFCCILLQAPTWSDCLGLLLVATPLLADSCFCVLRRLFAGHRIFTAHRLHLFQRLHQAGWSHAQVSSTYIFMTFLLGISMIIGGLPWVILSATIVFIFGMLLDLRFAVPFSLASCN